MIAKWLTGISSYDKILCFFERKENYYLCVEWGTGVKIPVQLCTVSKYIFFCAPKITFHKKVERKKD